MGYDIVGICSTNVLRPDREVIDLDAVPSHLAELREAYACFPSGVTAVCAMADGVPVGMTASSFTSASVGPPLVSVCVQNTSETWPRLRHRARLGVSVLAERQDRACRSLSTKDGDRFAGVDWVASRDGAVFVDGATLWLACSVHSEIAAGDHAIVLLEIHGLRADRHTAPLVFHGSRFRRLAAI